MLDILIPVATLFAALFILIKGADAFIDGAKQVGAAAGMSSFAIGVFIVGMGTSLPEFTASIAAVIKGETAIIIANVVGSNITNILLVIGISVVLGGTILIKQDLLRSELPVFFIATTHFLLSLWDGTIDRIESLLLLGTFSAYLWYIFIESRSVDSVELTKEGHRPQLEGRAVGKVVIGLAGLLIGAKYSIDAIVTIGEMLTVPVGLISITVLAIGTSLPELFVSVRAILQKESELSIGNIFGSNAFNMLFVIGVPGVTATLVAGEVVMALGIPVLLAASTILFVMGLSKRIMRWEGIMMLIFFAFFLVKLVAFI